MLFCTNEALMRVCKTNFFVSFLILIINNYGASEWYGVKSASMWGGVCKLLKIACKREMKVIKSNLM